MAVLECVQATYTGSISAPNPLVALMSAVSTGKREEKDDHTVYHFEQKVCTPSYLVAIAIGHLEKRDLSSRCAVWSEPETVEKGAYEFADTEKFLATAESICG